MATRLGLYIGILLSATLSATLSALLLFSHPIRAQDKATSNPSKAVQEEDIHAAAFRFLMEHAAGSPPEDDIFCLSIDSDDSIHHDPPDALLQRVGAAHRTLRKASECKLTKKRREGFFGVYDKKTGKPAWMISVGSVKWLSDQEVRVWGRHLCGGLCMWSTTLKAQFEDGKWKVSIPPDAEINMSQADTDRDLKRSSSRVSR